MKRMNIILVSCSFALGAIPAAMASNSPKWTNIESSELFASKATTNSTANYPYAAHKVELDSLAAHLANAQLKNSAAVGLKTWLPTPEGKQVEFYLWESPILASELANKYPEIKTFYGQQVGKPSNDGRFDLTELGFRGMFQLDGQTVFVDPLRNNHYQSYYKHDFMGSEQAKALTRKFNCKVKGHQHGALSLPIGQSKSARSSLAVAEPLNLGDTLRTYRLAVATTGEYSKFHGGKSQSMASVVSAINRVNEIYQRDLSVKLELVANNDKIIYEDPATDPFTGNDDGDTLFDESQSVIDKNIGSANYDVGHTFSTGGGGLAGLGVVCSSSEKAGGITGSDQPTGDPYWVDYVAHELGHQFNAEHSFNGSAEGCAGNRVASWAFEPGSATTVMGYASLCGEIDLQSNSDAYFHTTSIEQIKSHLTGSADSCAQKSVTNNAVPKVNAGADYQIPKQTPFKLTAAASDDDSGDRLTYTWEQRDLGAASESLAQMKDDGKKALFRSWSPSTEPTRYFPRLQEVLAGGDLVKGESYPTHKRELNFVVTVRDQKGGVNSDATLIKVDDSAGPFVATFPKATSHWAPSSKQYAQWSVANTTSAPISCSTVDIKLSIDQGKSFVLLAENTANDGQELLNLPSDKTANEARFFVECSSQPFFAVSKAFKISAAGLASTEQPSDTSNQAPIAKADSYSVEYNSNANKHDLLANDSDSDSGDSFSIVQVTTPSNGGQVTIIENGKRVEYSPAVNYSGQETYSYTINDTAGASAQAKVTVTVQEQQNSAPVATNDSYSVDYNSQNNGLNLLANDSDPDSADNLKITAVTAISDSATVSVAADGQSVNYSPANGFSGNSSFSYTISDQQGATSQARVTVTVKPAPVTPPTTPEEPAPSSGGGGAAGLWLLLLLAIRKRYQSL